MSQKSRTIYMPFRGLGNRFNQAGLTPEYCTQLINWDITPTGDFETINTFSAVNTSEIQVTVTTGPFPYDVHHSTMSMGEFVTDTTNFIVYQIGPRIAYAVNSLGLPGATQVTALGNADQQSYNHIAYFTQFDDKLIVVDGTSRNGYLVPISGTANSLEFKHLIALLEDGQIASTSASATQLQDPNITNWITQTNVNNNDLVRNLTKKGFAIVTNVATAAITHTRIDASAFGSGILSAASTAQEPGDFYQIEDMTELNIIPTQLGDDNVAVAGTNTSATGIYFTAAGNTTKFSWSRTQIRVGDYVLNTTRNAATAVTAVTTSVLRCEGISTMVAGDSLVFLKSAMPIASYAHTHLGRLYMIDSRDPRLIRISGPGDPQDMTVDAGTLDATSVKYGTQSSEAEKAVSLATFQRFLVVGGTRNVYVFEGTDPIADVSSSPTGAESTSVDFNIIATFPGGIRGPGTMKTLGNDIVYITDDGVQSVSQSQDSSLLNITDISEGIKHEFIRNTFTCESIFNFQEKMWIGFCFKNRNVSNADESYVLLYNYSSYIGRDQTATNLSRTGQLKSGFWTKINVSAWNNRAYFVDASGTMLGMKFSPIVTGSGNVAWQFPKLVRFNSSVASHADASASSNAAATAFSCVFQTSWLGLSEPRESRTVKDGTYFTPTISYDRYANSADTSAANVTITVCAANVMGRAAPGVADYDHSTDILLLPSDDILDSVAAAQYTAARKDPGWKDYYSEKHPLMWHGNRVRFKVVASVREAKVIMSNFNVEYNESGMP